MGTYWIGVDPGTPVALALVDPDERMVGHASDAQVLNDAGENDPTKMAAIIKSWSDFMKSKGHTVKVVIEKVGIRPNENLIHAVPFVGSMYLAGGIAAALGLATFYAAPQRWKREMKLTSDKKVSLGAARSLFPEKALFFKRLKDHNIAEAALLALYGHRHL